MKDSIYKKNSSVVYKQVGDDLILVPVNEEEADLEKVYMIGGVGIRIWELLDGKNKVSKIIENVIDEYETTDTKAESDAFRFLEDLMKHNCIVEVKAPAVSKKESEKPKAAVPKKKAVKSKAASVPGKPVVKAKTKAKAAKAPARKTAPSKSKEKKAVKPAPKKTVLKKSPPKKTALKKSPPKKAAPKKPPKKKK
ncbi:MAG: PqqD family protein [Chloroflexi bacterium]|nr:PqqD family protein [Chloroflexota bacterium]